MRMPRLPVFVLMFGPALSHGAGFEQALHPAVADTYIERGSPAVPQGSAQTLLMKRASATSSNGTDRACYLRFSVDSDCAAVTDALLELTFSQYPGDGTTAFTFDVYGLPDGHANETFDEDTLTFSSAVNASSSISGSFNPTGLVTLGSFTPSAASGSVNVEFTSTSLRDFVANSANSAVTIAIVRQTVNGLPSYIHSSEASSAFVRPSLVLRRPANAETPVTISASSTIAGSSVSAAADADPSTRWTAVADTSSTKSSITFDFGAPRTINRLNFIAHEFGRAYKLESSDNNTTWSLIASDFRGAGGSGPNNNGLDADVYFQPRTARYFRLSSLTSLSGKSVSFREVQYFNDASASPFLARAASLGASVSVLSSATAADQIKKTVLELSIERAQASYNGGDVSQATALLDDAQNGLTADAAAMSAQVSGLPNIRTLKPLLVTGTAANPYLKRMVDGANLFLAASDPPWEKNTPYLNVLEDFNLARTTGAQMDALFWLFANPDSPLKNNAEILRRLLRRSHAYIDAIRVHGPALPAGQLSSFYDDFGFTPASGVMRELPMLYPGLLGTNAAADWNAGIATAAGNLWAAYQNRAASWVNTDAAIACSLYHLGERTGNPAMLAKAEYFINDILTSGRMFADGAVGYIGTQNEAGGYQWIVSEYVGRYQETTGSANASLILSKMQWYGAINGRLADWWTSPSWKDAWNDIRSCFPAGEAVAGMNPYVRAELDAWIGAPATLTNWYGRPRVDVARYQTGTTALNRPDYTVFDRNTQGPRAWYGRWNYSATLRNIDPSEAGHYTVMGAQVADPDPDFRTNASLMGVFPRIRVTAAPSRNADTSFNESGHAWLTSGMTGDCAVTKDFSSIGVSYQIHQYASSAKGASADWTARQVWLNLPDRVIGLLDIAPNSEQSAYEVQGVVRLGFGGTSYSATKTLVSTGADSWSYGDLRLKLHSHNFAEVTPETYLFRVAAAPITELTLRDAAGAAANTTPVVYQTGQRRFYVTETRPASAVGEVVVTRLEENGLIGLDVDHPSTGRRYRVLYNPGASAVVHTPVLSWSGPVRVHQSGARFRPDWLPDPSGPLVSSYLTNGQSLTIPAAGHVVLEQCAAVIKANNADSLNLDSTWLSAPPADGGIATWNSTVTGSGNVSTGTGLNLAGIRVVDPGGDVALQSGSPGTLAIGPSGIDLTDSQRLLGISAPVRLDAPQTWRTGISGAAGSTQITAAGVISGNSPLVLESPMDRGFAFSAANTFSGGCTLLGGTANYSAAPAVAPVSGALPAGPFGTGPLVIRGGALVAGSRPFYQPSVSLEGDFSWSTTARVDASGNFDLSGGTRTISLSRSATPANVVVSGGNNAIRFTTLAGGAGSNTFFNGSLRIAAAASVAAPNLTVATFGTLGGNRFMNNAGLVVGPRAYVSASFTSSPFGTAADERPAVTLEAGSWLSLSDGGTGRGPSIFSLAGSGTVLNNTSGTAARNDTLTIDGGVKTSTSDFSGMIRDTDLSTFPSADPNLRVSLVKAGATVQILSGSALHTGSTTVNGGVLRITGALTGTSTLTVASGSTAQVSGPLQVTGDIVNHGTITVTGTSTFGFTGTFTNHGLLDLSGWSGTVPSGIVNLGTIIPPPGPGVFSVWQSLVWPGETNPAITGPSADPDGDGTGNLAEWALHLDPKQADVFVPEFSRDGTSLSFSCVRRKTSPGELVFTLEWADSPGGPWSGSQIAAGVPVSLDATSERVSFTLPAGDSGRRFVRIRLEHP